MDGRLAKSLVSRSQKGKSCCTFPSKLSWFKPKHYQVDILIKSRGGIQNEVAS